MKTYAVSVDGFQMEIAQDDDGKFIIPEVWRGVGTALKPAWEPVVLARKPLSEPTVAANVLKWGTGAINIDGCRIETAENLNGGAYAEVGGRSVSGSLHAGSGMNVSGKTAGTAFMQPLGRWPANLCHDGSDEVIAAFPTTHSGDSTKINAAPYAGLGGGTAFATAQREKSYRPANGGSAARFFYSAKANKEDRAGSSHPTVKPVALMRWLARLVTPPGGLILDPFAGSGTTGAAAIIEGFDCVLIEREPAYVADIHSRLAALNGTGAHSAVSKSRRRATASSDQFTLPIDPNIATGSDPAGPVTPND